MGPFSTNDGPVHMSFARLFWFGPSGPLQQQLYAIRHALDPNLLAYLIGGPLIAAIGAVPAESVLQAICLVALPLGAWFAVAALRRPNAMLAILVASMSLNQMFFLGLYNYSLSIAAALFAFGSVVRAARSGGAWWLAFGGALVVCFIAHAAGLIMALAFALAWLLPAAVADIARAPAAALRRYAPALLACIPAFLLMAQFAARQKAAAVAFGPDLASRLVQLTQLQLLATHGGFTRLAAAALAAGIAALAAWSALARLRAWRGAPASRLDTIRFALLCAGSLFLVMAFPDTAGGGWTHVRRMMLLPYIAAVLLCAAHPWPARARRAIGAFGCAVLLVLCGAAVRQQLQTRQAVGEIDALLQQVGAHCTVLPIIPHPRQVGARVINTDYEPLFQAVTRVEQHQDRVALFNFLARLDVYPVTYRPGSDPQQLIFHWRQGQTDTAIETADIAAFEQSAGAKVDYLLVQGDAAALPAGLRAAPRGYALLAGPSALRFSLYARAGSPAAGSACR